MKRLVCLAMALGIFSLPAHAEFSVQLYKEIKHEGGPALTTFKNYLSGVGTGLSVANVVIPPNGITAFYCPTTEFGRKG